MVEKICSGGTDYAFWFADPWMEVVILAPLGYSATTATSMTSAVARVT